MSLTDPQHLVVQSCLKCECTRKGQASEHRGNTKYSHNLDGRTILQACKTLEYQSSYCTATWIGFFVKKEGESFASKRQTLKQSLQKGAIATDHWETISTDREWRLAVYSRTQLYETERRKKQLDKRAAEKIEQRLQIELSCVQYIVISVQLTSVLDLPCLYTSER